MLDLRSGDLLACYGGGATRRSRLVSSVISWRTANPLAPTGLKLGPAHVALIVDDYDRPAGEPLWVESTSLTSHPCLIRGAVVSGCQAHRPETRIADYVANGGYVDVYRLTDAIHSELDHARWSDFLLEFVRRGVAYDFRGAAISAGPIRRRLLGWWCPHAVFCSALAARAMMIFNVLNWDDARDFTPGRLCRTQVQNGVYTKVNRIDQLSDFDDPEPAILPLRPAA